MFTICVNNHEEALTVHVGLKLDGGVLEETFVSCLATDALVLFCEGGQLAMYARSWVHLTQMAEELKFK